MTEPFKLSNDKINEIIYYLVASSTKCDMINANALSNLFNRLHNTTPDPESSLVKMSESGHFTAINLIKQCD